MKIALKIVLIVGILAYIIFAIIQFAGKPEDEPCAGVDVEVMDEEMQSILTSDYVLNLLSKNHFTPVGELRRDIDLATMETALLKDPYISEVNCFFSANNNLCIKVHPLRPILHVMAETGEDYYIDTTGVVMPVSNFNLDLLVATGHINAKTIKQELLPLAWYLHEDEYWSSEAEQIYVKQNGDIVISPRVGSHHILLGTLDNFQEKLANMKLFNEKGFPQVGWNKYRTIDLRYKGQVIGVKDRK